MNAPKISGPIELTALEGGTLWHVQLAAPKGNIIDGPMIQSLLDVFDAADREPHVKAILIEGAGPHFSFGASVQDHLPGKVDDFLIAFHELFRKILATGVYTMAAVQGQCLGGGLELAAFTNRVFATPDARLGQPEIRLGVFAPVASVILTGRVRRPHAEQLCLTGRLFEGREAAEFGLVDELAEKPHEAACEYFRQHLAPHSASTLRHAVRAVREGFGERLRAELSAVERRYREDLMATRDAREGVQAFIEKRTPEWRDE